MTLLHFAQSLGDAPSIRSVANIFAPSLRLVANICSLASLSRWGDAPSLCSVAGGMLPRFAQSLIYAPLLRSVANIFALSLHSVAFYSMVPSNCSKICILEGQRSSIFSLGSLVVGTSIRLPKY